MYFIILYWTEPCYCASVNGLLGEKLASYITEVRISLLLTLILGFASDLCNNKDILLLLLYNYNISLLL